MKYTALATLASALAVSAAPLATRNNDNSSMSCNRGMYTDTDILQYALTLEHLEKVLYHEMLSNFTYEDFANAGYPKWVRGRFEQIAMHESDHVSLLSSAIGSNANAACEYYFPYSDPKSFVELAHLIETLGGSAYAGAAQYISSQEYLTVAASILGTENRHQSWESSAVLHRQPWQGPYETPLGSLSMVYTLASMFITSCPSSNQALPVMEFPYLTVGGSGSPGETVEFKFDDPHNATNYAIFYSGLGTAAVMLDENDMAMIPSNLQGIYYVVISTASDASMVTEDNIRAGPAIVPGRFSAFVSNPPFTYNSSSSN